MATIAGVTATGWALPETPVRKLVRSLATAASGSMKAKMFRAADREFTIFLKAKTTTLKDSLEAALLAGQAATMSIDPDTPIDLGNGAGVAVNAWWIDGTFTPVKDNHDAWDITLKFRYAS